jgi:hypothetical protein
MGDMVMEPLGFIGLLYFGCRDPIVSAPMKTVKAVDKWAAAEMSRRRNENLVMPEMVRYAELKWEVGA